MNDITVDFYIGGTIDKVALTLELPCVPAQGSAVILRASDVFEDGDPQKELFLEVDVVVWKVSKPSTVTERNMKVTVILKPQ